MKTTKITPKTSQASVRKPEGLPKVKLGTGKNVLWMSETLFDEDLKK